MRMASARFLAVSVSVATALTLVSCSEKIEDKQPALGGSCLGCHDGITQIHSFFALSCTDCHGGNDNVPLPADLNIRDSALMKLSHVLPKDPEMWWPNGIDDNNDGRVD